MKGGGEAGFELWVCKLYNSFTKYEETVQLEELSNVTLILKALRNWFNFASIRVVCIKLVEVALGI